LREAHSEKKFRKNFPRDVKERGVSAKEDSQLLDEYAGRAMAALIEKRETSAALDQDEHRKKIAERSYKMAQAMLDERRRLRAAG
jgi:hypothetical protein